MIVTQVFVRGDSFTPQRFWEYALRTETKHGQKYHELGFIFSEKSTKEYIELSDTDKKKVSFYFINGERNK